jgi:hypothetical protein
MTKKEYAWRINGNGPRALISKDQLLARLDSLGWSKYQLGKKILENRGTPDRPVTSVISQINRGLSLKVTLDKFEEIVTAMGGEIEIKWGRKK